MKKLFGTDGVRGLANLDMTPELSFKLGMAGAYVLTKTNKHVPTILIGRDTRLSGYMLESALVAGMCAVGANVCIARTIPTPGIAYLVKKYNFDAGVMISASHNPYEDNGIKIFNGEGYKLADDIEETIENLIDNGLDKIERALGDRVGTKRNLEHAIEDYFYFLYYAVRKLTLHGLKIAVDCANGATYKIAPRLFKNLGAEVIVMGDTPNGLNINDNCGSTHMESLQKLVLSNKADLGIAFDGDGDRCLLVDENGNILEGDEILAILSISLKEKGLLNKNTLVSTVMSNIGLSIMGKEKGINIEKTSVGDRYVLEKMLENGYNLGGEQSGHIIMLDHNTTGDGILTALNMLAVLQEKNIKLSEAKSVVKIFPQVVANAKVTNDKKSAYLNNEMIKNEILRIEDKFLNNGRVLIRASGTEPLIRVMIEGQNIEDITHEANKLVEVIENNLY